MTEPRLLLLDNVDSFTFMLADGLRVAGADVKVMRHDAITVEQALRAFEAIVISPGPGAAGDAGISVALAAACVAGRKPMLGVCLGHQALALACNGRVERTAPMHGKIAVVRHDGSGLFAGLPSPLDATRYHSLAVTGLPDALVANAWSEDGTVMAIRHCEAPAHGLQFHPESIASAHGIRLLETFVAGVREGA